MPGYRSSQVLITGRAGGREITTPPQASIVIGRVWETPYDPGMASFPTPSMLTVVKKGGALRSWGGAGKTGRDVPEDTGEGMQDPVRT